MEGAPIKGGPQYSENLFRTAGVLFTAQGTTVQLSGDCMKEAWYAWDVATHLRVPVRGTTYCDPIFLSILVPSSGIYIGRSIIYPETMLVAI